MSTKLTIDPEFRDKIPPLTETEYAQLRENILADGEVYEPIIVWNGTIIDGHNRWKIIQEHPEIPYKIKQMDFPDRHAAIVWMCKKQIGRRNITDEQRTVLIGEAYKAQKMSKGGDRGNQFTKEASHQNEDLPKRRSKTSERIASAFGVGKATVERAEQFLDGLNAAEAVVPGFKEAVLAGDIKVKKNEVAAIKKMPEPERPAAVEAILNGESPKKKSYNPAGFPKQEREQKAGISAIIADMYDTDTESDYDISALLEEIAANADSYIRQVKRTLEIRSSIVSGNEAAVVDSLFTNITQKINEIMEELKNA